MTEQVATATQSCFSKNGVINHNKQQIRGNEDVLYCTEEDLTRDSAIPCKWMHNGLEEALQEISVTKENKTISVQSINKTRCFIIVPRKHRDEMLLKCEKKSASLLS